MKIENNKKEINFEKTKEKFINFLEAKDNTIMVLATSFKNRVIARNVLIANNGLDIYFFTWGNSRKCEQIKNNPKVALCKDKVQIEGTAKILGDLFSQKNKKYTDIIRNKFPEAIKRWEQKPGMVIVRIKPNFICVNGATIDDDVYLEYLDIENKKAYREKWAYY
jgi:general stress protein 26